VTTRYIFGNKAWKRFVSLRPSLPVGDRTNRDEQDNYPGEMSMPDIHRQIEGIANRIEAELKILLRWDKEPLPEEKYENMGAFGSNTMSFVQWLQFVLIPRIRDIVREKKDFPAGSKLTAHALREFAGDPNSGQLSMLLSELDQLVNWPEGEYEDAELAEYGTKHAQESISGSSSVPGSISEDYRAIPPVLFTLARVLPELNGDELEHQLQTFDTFLAILPSAVRPAIRDLLKHAAEMTPNGSSRKRIEKAQQSVATGGSAGTI
jgi:uncharacterized protein YqcC (DUF446 family)